MLKIHKTTQLLDGNGRKLNRKIRCDEKGLFVINHGMKGRLIKTVKTNVVADTYLAIRTIRKVDYYTGV